MTEHTRSIDWPSIFVSRIDVHLLDVKTSHKSVDKDYHGKKPPGGTRSAISKFTRKSRTRLLHKARNTPGLTYMVTVTYPHSDYAATARGGNFLNDGRRVNEHFRRLRQALTRRGISAVWFKEYQDRGVPHWHLITDKPIVDLHKVKKTWWKIVGSDCPHHLRLGIRQEKLRKKHSAGAYAAKYGSKSEQKTVPAHFNHCGRFWGYFGPAMKEKMKFLSPSQSEVLHLSRIARRAARAHARAHSYQSRVRRLSPTRYNVAPALRYYLARLYNIPEIDDETLVIRLQTSSLAS